MRISRLSGMLAVAFLLIGGSVNAASPKVVITTDNVVKVTGVGNSVAGIELHLELNTGSFSDTAFKASNNSAYTFDKTSGSTIKIYSTGQDDLSSNGEIVLGTINTSESAVFVSNSTLKLVDFTLQESSYSTVSVTDEGYSAPEENLPGGSTSDGNTAGGTTADGTTSGGTTSGGTTSGGTTSSGATSGGSTSSGSTSSGNLNGAQFEVADEDDSEVEELVEDVDTPFTGNEIITQDEQVDDSNFDDILEQEESEENTGMLPVLIAILGAVLATGSAFVLSKRKNK